MSTVKVASCEFPDEPSLAKLEDRCKAQYVIALHSERQCAEVYHRLGSLLTSLRSTQSLPEGTWMEYVKSLGMDYNRVKRACRLFKLYPKGPEAIKDKNLAEALGFKPNENVKKAKQAQAAAKRKANGESNAEKKEPEPPPPAPTAEELEAAGTFLLVCQTIERARFVLEAIAHE
jgi:hypothetical protein